MSVPDVRTEITDVHGPTHTGTGDQTNITYYQFLEDVLKAPTAATRRPITPDDVTWLRARFEPPPGFDRAVSASASGPVILCGASGDGRETAARMLLCQGEDRAANIQEIELDNEDALALGDVEGGDRLLLDLSSLERGRFVGYQGELRSLVAEVVDKQARLAVVVANAQAAWLADDLRRRVVPLGRPDPLRVIRRHLGRSGADFPVQRIEERHRAVLHHASMRSLVRVAELINEEGERLGGEPARRLIAAIEAISGYPGEVGQLLDEHAEGRQRALLLASTVFEGARLDVVAAAEHHLLRVIEFPEPEQHWLAAAGLLGRLHELGVEVEARCVKFGRLGYGSAAFARLWDEYAGLHQELARWLAEAVAAKELSDDERVRAADRLGDQLLRSGDMWLLRDVVRSWAVHARKDVRALAFALLGRAALDGRGGREVRAHLYRWAQDPSLSPRMAHVVLAVCERVLAPVFPAQAVVRLRLLTLHSDPRVSSAARAVLVGLADDDRMYRRIMGVLAGTTGIDPELFGALAEPHRVRGAWLTDRFRACWRAVFGNPDVRLWSHSAWRWLDEVAEAGRADLLDVLAAATRGDNTRAARLFVVARAWSRETAAGPEVLRNLRDLLDQDITGAAPAETGTEGQ